MNLQISRDKATCAMRFLWHCQNLEMPFRILNKRKNYLRSRKILRVFGVIFKKYTVLYIYDATMHDVTVNIRLEEKI